MVERELTNYLMRKASLAKIPLSGTFELSPVCNLACKMCYVRKTPAEVAAHNRPLRTLDDWLATAKEARKQGLLYLLLTGGEPFLWQDFWPLYDALSEMGFLISINSNGTLIDEAAILRLKKAPPVRINITLYGASNETYEALCQAKGMFDRVDKNIRALHEAGIQVKLNCSLTPYNVADLEKMQAYAKEQELLFQATAYMFPPIRRNPDMVGQNDRFTPTEAAYYHMQSYRLQNGEERYERFLHNIVQGMIDPPGLDEQCIDPVDGKIHCRAGNASFWITWDGFMTPCGMMPNPKADLREQSFLEAWEEITRQSAALKLSGVCEKCANQRICHVCAAAAMAETGTAAGIPQYMCRLAQEMKRLAIEELGI